MNLPKNECARCGGSRSRFGWQVFSNGTKHIRVECAECGAYVCYAPQTPEHLRRAGPPPEGDTPGDEHEQAGLF